MLWSLQITGAGSLGSEHMDTAGTGIRFVLLNKALGVLGKGSQGDEEALLEQGTWGGRTGAVGEDPHFSGHASCRGGGNGPHTLS